MTDKHKHDRFDKLTLGVAIAGVVVITWQSTETHRAVDEAKHATDVAAGQLKVMQGQLDEMRYEQRPWISLSGARPAIALVRNVFGRLVLRVEFPMKNVGHTPARYALIDGNIFVRGPTAPEMQNIRNMCAQDRRRPIGIRTQGITLFPDETYIQPYNFVLDKREEWRLVHEKGTTVMIAGCVDYLLADGTGHHQTAYVFELDRSGPDGTIVLIDPKSVPIPQNQLLLEINPALTANAD